VGVKEGAAIRGMNSRSVFRAVQRVAERAIDRGERTVNPNQVWRETTHATCDATSGATPLTFLIREATSGLGPGARKGGGRA